MLWGVVNNPSHYAKRLLERAGGAKARECIDFLLDVFEKYQIPATWAVVGHLFLDPCHRKGDSLPKHESRFTNSLSMDICTNSYDNALFFGKDIVEKILSSKVGHEIGYHSFSHQVFSKICKEVADSEIKAGIEIAKQFNISFKSFVFPEDEIGHIDVLKKYGFLIYRGKTLVRWRNLRSHMPKIDGLFNETVALPVMPNWKDGIWEIPSSMYFTDPKYPFCLLPKARLGLWRTMRSNSARAVFHVTMHPWNLLEYPSLSKDFECFIRHVSRRSAESKIRVMTMGELASDLQRPRAARQG